MTPTPTLSWFAIIRLGLVQTALGAMVALTTATLNRVMVVELALPAMLPGALVALHYGIQITRPVLGYGSDVAGRRTPWIIGGIGLLALGGTAAAIATVWMATQLWAGILLGIVAFAMIGLGVGAAGTSLLALLAKRAAPRRRPAAAALVWMMMIVGIILSTALGGHFLEPFSPARLVAVTASISVIAFTLATVAVLGIERDVQIERRVTAEPPMPFMAAIAEIWAEPKARQFSIFVFVSMLAYSAQDLILEPFAGTVFDYSPKESTQLSSVQHSGVLAGMIFVAILGSGLKWGSLRFWTVTGCLMSAAALAGLAMAGKSGGNWPLHANVAALGFSNGIFAVAAIGSMMGLAGDGRGEREGTRMGMWGASQAMAFGLGGFMGTVAIDLTRVIFTDAGIAYGTVFLLEGSLFLLSAILAMRIGQAAAARPSLQSAATHLGG